MGIDIFELEFREHMRRREQPIFTTVVLLMEARAKMQAAIAGIAIVQWSLLRSATFDDVLGNFIARKLQLIGLLTGQSGIELIIDIHQIRGDRRFLDIREVQAAIRRWIEKDFAQERANRERSLLIAEL